MGRTLVLAFSKCEGVMQPSTYGGEFVMAQATIEGILSIWYSYVLVKRAN
jgi:hypothetical protein